jgi:hypothetical protein
MCRFPNCLATARHGIFCSRMKDMEGAIGGQPSSFFGRTYSDTESCFRLSVLQFRVRCSLVGRA